MTNLKKISELIKGTLQGDPDFTVQAINSIEKAGPREITFAARENIKIELIQAGALIVARNSKLQYNNLIYVDEPYTAFATLLDYFFPHRRFNQGIDSRAYVSETAEIGEDVSIGPFSYIGDNTEIGPGCEIHAGVKIYDQVTIGKNCLIYANVVIREDVKIGEEVIIQPGVIIGADGFGFTRLSDGTPAKIPQKGKVIIGDRCEIGANTCIDRSTIEETLIGEYVKMDNLVQVGHNVKIGRGTAISSLSGISGSTEVGENVIMAGQVGVADHIKIADGAIFAGKTGVTGNIKEKGIYAGYPYQEVRKWQKSVAIFRNLEKYIERIKNLEKKIEKLEEK